MGIKDKIENDFKQALKKRDENAISTLRMLKADLHNKEIEKRGEQLQDAEIIKVIFKQIQQHKYAIEQFAKGKRQDLVEKETKELSILEQYLPKQLSQQEIIKIVKQIIEREGAKEKKDFGKVMKAAMAELSGQADGKSVSQIVTELLS